MKITVIAVSAPALLGLIRFQEKYKDNPALSDLEWSLFNVASGGMEAFYKKDEYIEALAGADLGSSILWEPPKDCSVSWKMA